MAIAAPGDPPPHPKTVTCLSSIPDDEDMMVFSAFHPVSLPFSLHTHCGTNHNIENSVANISSSQSFKSNQHAPNQLASPSALIILSPPTPPFSSKHFYDNNNAPCSTIGCCSMTSVDLATLSRQVLDNLHNLCELAIKMDLPCAHDHLSSTPPDASPPLCTDPVPHQDPAPVMLVE